MYPYFSIFGNVIPVYTLCFAIGIVVASLVLINMMSNRLILRKYAVFVPISLISAMISARLFGFVSGFADSSVHGLDMDFTDIWRNTGIVYFGGLIGFVVAFWISCKVKHIDFGVAADILAVVIPLFHVFGRIGCYFSGCCYGIESSVFFAIPYRINPTEIMTERIPIQLFEAGYELILFIIMYNYSNKHDIGSGRMLKLYFILYSVWRFFAEFIRGDEIRGVYFGISFSQIICVLILIFFTVIKYFRRKNYV